MIPQSLQEELKDVILEVTKNIRFKNPDGEETRLNVFYQDLPKKMSDEDENPCPYCIIRLVSGKSNAVDGEENEVRAVVLFGIYDSDSENQGHMTVLGIINKIISRFAKNNAMKTFYQKGNIEWLLDDDDVFPYFLGGMDMTFIPTISTGRELDDLL